MEKRVSHMCEEAFGELYNATSGDDLVGELSKNAREVEMVTLKTHGVNETAPLG